jgi:Fe2+ or Zn2+ uptake regulation protein
MTDATHDVNGKSPGNAQPGRGHNGGPPLQKFTAKHKVERIREVLEMDITAAQKCVGIGIVVEADTDWITPELSTDKLRHYASVKDRETVYRATKQLTAQHVVNPIREEGRPNRYVVLPSEAIDAVIDEIDAHSMTTRVSPEPPPPMKPDGMKDVEPVGLERTTPLGSNPTTPVEPVGSHPTGRVETDQPRVRARARKEPPSGVLLFEENNTPQPPSEPTPSDALKAFEAYNATALRCRLPQASKLTPDRQRKIIARLRSYGLDGWKRALANIEKSKFLTGSSDSGFRADLEFVCQAKSFARLHDGGYGNGRYAEPTPNARAAAEEFAAALERARLADEEAERCRR